MRITVFGGGSFGTALAHLLALKGHSVTMLVRDARICGAINDTHENPRYLPGLHLAPGLRASTCAETALQGAELLLLAVPCQHLGKALLPLAAHVSPRCIPVCVGKGIETGSLRRMSEVVADVLPANAGSYAILSGPSFAREVVEEKPTAVVLGCADQTLGESLRGVFSTNTFRVYSSTDVVGVELGGALKNIMAIAAGLCDGLGLGHNSRAALITRGLAEISRLGTALGACAATFMGLSGMGDLVLTCTGDLSRNRQVGLRIAAGESLEQITASMHMVAEGVKTTEAARVLGKRLGVQLPICDATSRVLDGESPGAVVRELMTRALKEE